MAPESLIVLASASPRRSELMALAGIPCIVEPAHICEDPLPGEEPAAHVERLSKEKAQARATRFRGEKRFKDTGLNLRRDPSASPSGRFGLACKWDASLERA